MEAYAELIVGAIEAVGAEHVVQICTDNLSVTTASCNATSKLYHKIYCSGYLAH